MARQLMITPRALDTMKQDAQRTFPNECCGFLYGSEGNIRKVVQAQPVENSKPGDQRRRFEISPLQYMQAEQYALEHELTLLGVYHSHPKHPAVPSEHDRVQALPTFSYVILNVEAEGVGRISSWELNPQRQFEEENIV